MKRMFRRIAIVFLATYLVAWLCLFAMVMEGEPREMADNFANYVVWSWTPGAGEVVGFIQFGALACAVVVALVGVPVWRLLRDLWRRARA